MSNNSPLLAKINDDFIWQPIMQNIAGKYRLSRQGWFNICCPMCLSLGESQDTRYRCGIRREPHIFIKCYNCDFRAGYSVGKPLGRNLTLFLQRLGIDTHEIGLRALQLLEYREMVEKKTGQFVAPKYHPKTLPPYSQSVEQWAAEGCSHPDYLDTIQFLMSRGEVVTRATTYYWTPEKPYARRLIIPCYHGTMLVGWIDRSIDPSSTMKYHKEIPSGYLFNTHHLNNPQRKFAFIVEGTFDALAIDGVAALGSSLNEMQIASINNSSKKIVVVPDRDAAGSRMVDIALEQNWNVAIPVKAGNSWWDPKIKDVDEAVVKYGKLFVVKSIIESISNNPATIRMNSFFIKGR
jgi:RNase P subunit RPR2